MKIAVTPSFDEQGLRSAYPSQFIEVLPYIVLLIDAISPIFFQVKWIKRLDRLPFIAKFIKRLIIKKFNSLLLSRDPRFMVALTILREILTLTSKRNLISYTMSLDTDPDHGSIISLLCSYLSDNHDVIKALTAENTHDQLIYEVLPFSLYNASPYSLTLTGADVFSLALLPNDDYGDLLNNSNHGA